MMHADPLWPHVYLAAPLFSDAERVYNEALSSRLEQCASVYLPQRDGGLMVDMLSHGLSQDEAARLVFTRDIDAIHHCEYVIAVLDGRAIDEGVAVELGVAFALGKRCFGLQTDIRRLASWGNNPMITGVLETTFHSIDELEECLVLEFDRYNGKSHLVDRKV